MNRNVCVIAPMGTSPPVVSEFIDYMVGAREHVRTLIIIDTEEEKVRASTEIVRIALKIKYPQVVVKWHTLDFPDIDTTERNMKFMETCSEIIRTQIERGDKIVANVGGGRKNMCITLTLLGSLLGINGAYHVVNKSVQDFNRLLEQMRKEIIEVYKREKEEEKERIYMDHKQDFEELLFPKPEMYEVIQLPLVPFPREVVGIIRALRETEDTRIEIPPAYRNLLSNSGLVEKSGNKFVPTSFGKALARVI